ncbi:MAG: TolC family protein [Bradymonadales bacterium]|nr:MAG: TolC family protein [Bradymonadales bacterium]
MSLRVFLRMGCAKCSHSALVCGLVFCTSIFLSLALHLPLGFAEELSPEIEPRLYSLSELIQLAEQNEALSAQISAEARLARAKRRQVEMELWMNQLDLRVLGGVVPDARVDRSSADAFLFDFQSSDFQNGFSFSELGPFVSMELRAVQPVYTFGKISGYRDMADANVRLTQVDQKKELVTTRQMLRKAVYTLQLSLEAKSLLTDVRNRLNQAEEKVEELLLEGAENVEETDRLKIGVFRADVETRALDALRGERVARAGIEELTGVSGNWELSQMRLEAEQLSSLSWENLWARVIEGRPEIQKIDQFIEVKLAERKTIRADLYPDLFVAGELQFARAPGRDRVKHPYLSDNFNRFQGGVAFGLQQDLGFHRTLNRLQQVDAEIARVRAQRVRLLSLTRVQAEEAFERAYSARRGIQINEEGFRSARSWLTSTGLAFSLGTAPTKDVLESYAAYFKARFDLLRSTFELNSSLSELSSLAGVDILGE